MSVEFHVLRANTTALQQQAFSVRHQVFVEEQSIPKADEFDQHDASAQHFLVLNSNTYQPIAAARWRLTQDGVKLERFAVLPSCRNQGVGSTLLSTIVDDILIRLPDNKVMYLNAQEQAIPFYNNAGFYEHGEKFDECGIPHIAMRKTR